MARPVRHGGVSIETTMIMTTQPTPYRAARTQPQGNRAPTEHAAELLLSPQSLREPENDFLVPNPRPDLLLDPAPRRPSPLA